MPRLVEAWDAVSKRASEIRRPQEGCTRDKKYVARDQLREKLELLGRVALTAEELEALTPLAVMRLVMAARMKAGDHAGALVAAEAAAPYVHTRLASADVRVTNTQDSMSDEELKAEIAELERRIAAASAGSLH